MASLQFSAEYIRSQPEYQYIITENKAPGRASINLNDLSLRIIESPTNEEEAHRGGPTPRGNHFNLKSKSTLTRPLTSPSRSSPSRTSNVSTVSSVGRLTRRNPSSKYRPHTSVPKNPSLLMSGSGIRNIHSVDVNRKLRRQSSSYDPRLDKTQQFLKGYGSSFSQASQALVPLTRGLRRVEVHYSETNVNRNDSLIFADLIRNSHKSNMIFQENVDGLERRLLTKRTDLNKATTFYDTVLRPSFSALPRSARTRTVAGKTGDRKKRIKKKNDMIELGYEPRAWTLHSPTEADFKNVLDCRYLRVHPRYQPELYEMDSNNSNP